MLLSLLANLLGLYGLLTLPYAASSIIDVSNYSQSNQADLRTSYYRPGAPYRLNQDSLGVKITAQAAMVTDSATGAVLWQKNSAAILPLASLTKLLSALVFLEHNPGWPIAVAVLAADYQGAGQAYIYPGEKLTVRDLFQLALIPSANSAMMALQRATGMASEEFAAKMNERALALGMSDSQFAEPTGLSADNAGTAADLIKLAQAAFNSPEIRQATLTEEYTFKVLNSQRTQTVKNTNKLLVSYLKITAGKTGSLDEAGYSLTAEVKGEQGQKVLAVVLGSASDVDRFQDLKALVQWAFDNYVWND